MSKLLEKELKELAHDDWEEFKIIMGENAYKKMQIVFLRRKGKSFGQISSILKIDKELAWYHYHGWLAKQG